MPRATEEDVRGFPAFDFFTGRVRNILDGYLERKVPSLLFTGPVGTGKEYAAIDFARRILCEREAPCDMAGEASADVCDGCFKISKLEHPGLHIVYPTPTQGTAEKAEDDAADIGKVLEEKRRDIFSDYRFTKKVSIRIARARAVIQRANTKPFGSSHNIFILVDAHTMREEAQNALLKLVEEPPERSILIWITPNPDAILYTIRSRCQHVRFAPLKTKTVEMILTAYYGTDEASARKAANLSQGGIKRAREMLSSDTDEDKELAYDFLAHVLSDTESRVITRAVEFARGASRDGAARMLHELTLAYRDLMCGEEELFINRDQKAFLQKQIPLWRRENLPGIIDRISRAREEILFRNLNIEATLVDLFLAVKRSGC
jgi:DNA polymerase-3 subunit delta'